MIALDKDQWYYLDELTTEQLREVAAAIMTDIDSRKIWTHNDKDTFETLKDCLHTKRLLFTGMLEVINLGYITLKATK